MAEAMKVPAKPDSKLPVVYEDAIRDLIACQTLDEAKYFADKSDALAVWSKIYKSDRAAIEAKRLKAHAYRRIGELAGELAGEMASDRAQGKRKPEARKILKAHGFSVGMAERVRVISNISKEKFDAAMGRPNPPSIRELVFSGDFQSKRRKSKSWFTFAGASTFSNANTFRSFCRRFKAKDVAIGIQDESEVRASRQIVVEIQDWLDEFEQFLPKAFT